MNYLVRSSRFSLKRVLPCAMLFFCLAGSAVGQTTKIVAVANRAGSDPAPPIPTSPLSAISAAVQRMTSTPGFPYGRQYLATRDMYFLLRTQPAENLKRLQDSLHRDSVWLRQLTEEIRGQGFDPANSTVQAEGGKLLWELVPFQYPPLQPVLLQPVAAQPLALQPAFSPKSKGNSTAFYDPVSGTVRLASQAGRWPRAVSLLHEAMHAMQSEPGKVSATLMRQAPWTAKTWLYYATRERPLALEAAVECGPSLLTGIATSELYHRALPGAPAIRAALVTPAGRAYNTEWLLRQAHRFGVFGDSATARALGYSHREIVGINDLLGSTSAGRQFLLGLLPEE
jgi:hypothetical protein